METTKTYRYDDVYRSTLEYFGGDDFAATTWIKKYCLTKDDEYLELNPSDMHRRMAVNFARIERKFDNSDKTTDKSSLSEYGRYRYENKMDEEAIFNYFDHFRYIIPAGSVMSGLGSGTPVSLSNCFVINGPEDSIDDIFRVCNEQSQLMKRRGGVGFDISKLRPCSASVNNSAKYSTGAASFMDLFSHVTNTISQMGRRGALMLSINIKHPDSLEFIEKKQDLTKVTGANVSVQIDDDFMISVAKEGDYYQVFPITKDIDDVFVEGEHEYGKLYEGKECNTYFKKVNAKEIWDRLIHCAWNTAEPGIMFRTNHHDYSPDGVYESFRGTCTNPCGEIYMHEDSCRLIHLNLSSFVLDEFKENCKIDYDKLYSTAYDITLLADDLVELEAEHLQRVIDKVVLNDGDKDKTEHTLYKRLLAHGLEGRRCGIGFTALADMVAKMGLKYDSDEAFTLIRKVMSTIFKAELDAEVDMAVRRGHFPLFDSEKEIEGNSWYNLLKKNYPDEYDRMMTYGRRNVSFSTVAPTGTASLLARTSSGIEPVFKPYYIRRRKCMSASDRVDFIDPVGEKFTEFVVVHPLMMEYALSIGMEVDNDTKIDVWDDIYKDSPWYKSTAEDIDWVKRVELQGIVQEFITHSISSTVNLPNDVTKDKVSEIYMHSWKNGLKGITVYRDGCRSGVMVDVDTKKKTENKVCIKDAPMDKRPKEIPCKIFRFNNKGEKWVGVVGLVNDKPYEIFTGVLEKLNIPNWVEDGFIIRNREKRMVDDEEKMVSRYDICYLDKDNYRVCVEGLSRTFNPEYWNYAKLISGLLRNRMPIQYIIKVISGLNLDSSSINTWKNGVIRTLRKFNDSVADVETGEKCPECGGRMVREGGCIHCIDCGYSRCE